MCALAAKAAPLRGSSRDPARLRRAYRTTIDRSLARVAVVVGDVCCLINLGDPERNLLARQSCRTQQAQSRRTQAALQPPATARIGSVVDEGVLKQPAKLFPGSRPSKEAWRPTPQAWKPR